MTIERNGEKIELSKDELERAYREMDRNYTAEDIMHVDESISKDDALELAEVVECTLEKNDRYFQAYWDTVRLVIEEKEG